MLERLRAEVPPLFLKVPVQVQWAGFTEVSPSLALKAAKNS